MSDPPSVGPYQLVARLGAGGMGQVFLAADGRRQLVAVKLVHPALAHDVEFRSRFRREVAAGRRLDGPFVAAVLDADPEAATPWLATEYVPGPSLDDAVATVGPLGVGPARVLAHGLAAGLAGIHAAGLVHRDVKPSNVLLGPDRPRLIDFGISRAADATALTSTGAVLGTPAYMSPEQAEGLAVDAASDVFSFGAVLVFATVGRPPFGDGAAAAVLLRICDHEPDLAAVPGPLRGPVAACLAKAPGDRPTAAEASAMFDDATTEVGPGWLPATVTGLAPVPPPGPPTVGRPPVPPGGGGAPSAGDAGTPGRPGRRITRRTVLAGAGLTGLAAAAGVGATALVGARTVTVPQPPAATGPRLLWDTALTRGAQYPGATVELGDQLVYALASNVLHALDIGSGAVRWTHDFAAASDGPPRAYLTVVDGVVAVGTNTVVTALDAVTGAVRWESRLAAGDGDPAARVAAGDGLVHYLRRDALVTLDAATGAKRWTHPVASAVSDPVMAVAGGRVFVTATNLEAVDAATGAPVWRRPIVDDVAFGARLAVGADAVYRWVPAGSDTALAAVDAATGAPRWNAALGAGGSEGKRPALVGELVVVTVGAPEPTLRALDAATGATRWEGSADGRAVEVGPVAEGDAVCCGGRTGQVYVFDAATGRRRWDYADQRYLPAGDIAFRSGIAYSGRIRSVDAIGIP